MKFLQPLNDKAYDVLKWIAFLVIPTISAAVVAISEIWGVSIDENVLGWLSGIAAVIGVIINLSTTTYYTIMVRMPPPTLPVKVHQALQQITLYWLPAVATSYYVLSLYVNVPYTVPVVQTLITIQVFLGLILGTYSSQTGELKDWVKAKLNDMASKFGRPSLPSK